MTLGFGQAAVWSPWSSFSAIQTLISDWRGDSEPGGFAVEFSDHPCREVDVYSPVFLAGPPRPCRIQSGGHVLAGNQGAPCNHQINPSPTFFVAPMHV